MKMDKFEYREEEREVEEKKAEYLSGHQGAFKKPRRKT